MCQTSFADDSPFCGNDGQLTIQERSSAEHDARLGTVVGDYLLVAVVADGAMGRVYEARHRQSRDKVAVKVLHPEVEKDPVSLERFRREGETLGSLSHPHIVRVLEYGRHADGCHFMVMEFLHGQELSLVLRQGGALQPARALRVLCQLGLALDHAHSFGVIHRDLKPDNVFLQRSDVGDVVKILDFGSVKLQMEFGMKLTAFGTTLGSPYYMAPEQALGKADIDLRADVFAMASIAYELFTGKVAFEGGNIGDILMKILEKHPPSLKELGVRVPPGVDDVLSKGLSKDKAQRYAKASGLSAALAQAFGLEANSQTWADSSLTAIQQALELNSARAHRESPVATKAPSRALRFSSISLDEEALRPSSLLGRSSNSVFRSVVKAIAALSVVVFALAMVWFLSK